ncbi:putative bifunctional diguanylate cyclase/phosphodiesterase [Krasilnikovia sp. MM14-A1004]|uniref:putative bifunctional diguanylate cyclase/phosphodiesterase n=1 Tax=Krasilnikovia sp. MM14-A1004 TaxID=3373541 RepID=UPI00399C9473
MTLRRVYAAVSGMRPGTAVVLVVTAAFTAWMLTGLGGATLTQDVSNVGTFVLTVVAGGACLLRGARNRGRVRGFWYGTGAGMLSWALGQGIWSWQQTVLRHEVPFPSVADAGYLAMMPFITAGLLLAPVSRQTLAHRLRSVVDGLMIATSMLLVAWLLVVAPLIGASGSSMYELSVTLAYPLGDVVLITVVLHVLALLRRRGEESGPAMLVGAAMVIICVTDSVYVLMSLQGGYESGGLLDSGWFVGFALVLLAARLPGRPAVEDPEQEDTAEVERPFAIALPYTAVVGAVVISVVWFARTGHADAFFAWSRTLLIVLILARQMITLRENRHLTRHLEARVAVRTAELHASEQRFRALVQQSSDSVAIISADSTIFYQSDSVERIFGYPATMLLGHRLVEVSGKAAGPRIAAAIDSVRGEPYATTVLEVPIRHFDGQVRLAEMTITNLLDDPAVGGFVLNTRDIHDAKELQDQLLHTAYHDGLTGLASRALFRDRLEEALAAAEARAEVAILFLDLDGFKEVNDSLGHAAGDELLIRVAARIRETVREHDTVARFGGDEFAVLVQSISATRDAEAVARRIVAAIGEPVTVDGRDLHVGASIGLASGADADDTDQLLRNADLAMYKAKAGGGGGVASYDPKMHNVLVERLQLEADLRVALEEGQLALHYQPTVDLRSSLIVGFEALVRWHHPTRGMVSPLEFIGIAETTGLIVPLGRWVLAEACRQAVAWGADGDRELTMAVNVSVRQFEHGDLAEMVAEVLAETGMPAERLRLEMTESVLLTDTDENLAQLQRIRALGVTLAMDDFGTGYSSLAYLRRFPMEILKIDRSFVDRLGGGDREDVALVRTIVQLGQSLGMATVAEGIEDAVQLAALREMGCPFAQGYYLSRPLPAPEAGKLLLHGLPTSAIAA